MQNAHFSSLPLICILIRYWLVSVAEQIITIPTLTKPKGLFSRTETQSKTVYVI